MEAGGARRGVVACGGGDTVSRADTALAIRECRIVVRDGPGPEDGDMEACAQWQRGVACGGAIEPGATTGPTTAPDVTAAAPAARESRIVVWALRDAAARVVQEVVRCYARKMWGDRNRPLQRRESATKGEGEGGGGNSSRRRGVPTDGTSASQDILAGIGGSSGGGGQTWGEEDFGPENDFGDGQGWGEEGVGSETGLENGQPQDRPATVRSMESRRGTPNGGRLLLCSSASSSDRKGRGGAGGAPSRTMTASSGTESNGAPCRAVTASSGTGSVTRVSTAATRETTRETRRTTPGTGRDAAGARGSGSCYGTRGGGVYSFTACHAWP